MEQWDVEIANTPEVRQRGLGGRPSLQSGTGMLFDMGTPQIIIVTTVPMLFPIDIAFLDDKMLITEICFNIPPGYLVTSKHPARYFLEVNAGEMKDKNPGNRLTFTGKS